MHAPVRTGICRITPACPECSLTELTFGLSKIVDLSALVIYLPLSSLLTVQRKEWSQPSSRPLPHPHLEEGGWSQDSQDLHHSNLVDMHNTSCSLVLVANPDITKTKRKTAFV